ncbi:MAG: hypothetical protein L6Q75_19075 [Burkholderiaceae bacterium]|nr:hypothetical protein [Burkholderiaceae bacterium]
MPTDPCASPGPTCDPARRRVLAGGAAALLPAALGGCAPAAPLLGEPDEAPRSPAAGSAGAAGSDPAARRLFDEACAAHGLEAWRRVRDLSVSYDGRWRPLLQRLQPELVDAEFRGRSEERVLPRLGLAAQLHRGPGGVKQVRRQRGPAGAAGEVEVRYNGRVSSDRAVRDAAALVVDGYLLFLLGPLALADREAGGAPLQLRLGERETVRGRDCEQLQVRLAPGLGFAAADRLLLCIDRRERLVRRLRFSLEGLASTRGAVAEVDAWDVHLAHGIAWPTQFHERLRRPIPFLPVHDWQLTGLEIDRGFGPADLAFPAEGSGFAGRAAAPARALVAPSAGDAPPART